MNTKEKLYALLSGEDRKSLNKILLWGFLSAAFKAMPYFFLILTAVELMKPLNGETIKDANLITYCILMLVTYLFMYVLGMKSWMTISKDASEVIRSGRKRTLETFNHFSVGKILKKDTNEITGYLVDDYNNILIVVSDILDPILHSMVMPVLGFVGLLFLSPKLTLVSLIAVVLSFLLYFAMYKKSVRDGEALNMVTDRVNAEVLEYVNNIPLLRGFHMVGGDFLRLSDGLKALKNLSLKKEASSGVLIASCSIVLTLGIPLTAISGLFWWMDGSLSLASYVIFLIALPKIYVPLTTEFIMLDQLNYLKDSINHLYDLKMSETMQEGIEEKQVKGFDVEFQDVSFGYTEENVLEHVSFVAKQNEMTALVGHSGCGKSTILQLISRFYDNGEGTIKIGGQDIKTMPYRQLLSLISVVFQESYLFNDTIRNNMRLAKSDATDAEIEKAAKKAGCHDWIVSLPDGYDTMLGERGSTVSGGQRQRIAVARAILKDAPIILLDEATASLDVENENLVQKSMNELVKGKTVIVVAHHLNTIQNADQILLIGDKKILGEGTHTELMKTENLYHSMWDMQYLRTEGC